MHRLIMQLEPGNKRKVDHINHDPLDNRRENLRICSNAENMRNRKKCAGVDFYRRTSRWRAHITFNGRHLHLGYYATEGEARDARRKAELFFFKEFAPALNLGGELVRQEVQWEADSIGGALRPVLVDSSPQDTPVWNPYQANLFTDGQIGGGEN